MAELFTFADEQEWPTPRLEERFRLLMKSEKFHGEERAHCVTVEMSNIAFEGLQRARETHQREEEIEQLDRKLGSLAVADTQLTLPGMPKLFGKKKNAGE